MAACATIATPRSAHTYAGGRAMQATRRDAACSASRDTVCHGTGSQEVLDPYFLCLRTRTAPAVAMLEDRSAMAVLFIPSPAFFALCASCTLLLRARTARCGNSLANR